MTKLLEQIVADELRQEYGRVRDAACFPEGDINIIIKQIHAAIVSSYLRKRTRNRLFMRNGQMDKYLAELDEVFSIVEKDLKERYFYHKQRYKIARIEFPVLEMKVKEELGRKKIPYQFRTHLDENLLTVQVVNEHFYEIPVTLENVEKATRLMSYFINRPDCAREELPEIRHRVNYRLAKEWSKVATIP